MTKCRVQEERSELEAWPWPWKDQLYLSVSTFNLSSDILQSVLPVFGHIVYSLRYILLTIRDSTKLHRRLSMPLSITVMQ